MHLTQTIFSFIKRLSQLPVRLLLLMVCLNLSSVAYSQVTKIEASIDKNPVMLDESFTLTVTANGDVNRDAFDSSGLLSTFVVGRTSVSSQTRMVNFETSRTTTWSTTLFPRETGDFTIPAFQIEGQVSQPITVSVIPVSAGTNSESRDIFVTTELDKDTVYLHQQVKYSVKLYLAREIERGSLQAPELDNAEIQQIGKDAEYTEILNGKRYRIIERDFVIIPQRSGEFTINGPIFQGDVIANSRQSFGFFNRTQSVSRVGPSQKLNVLAIPDSVSGTFLPSEFVDIHQEWSEDPKTWRVGEPITRTITLTAVGLTESLLPEIDDKYPPDVKTYPDQANTATAENEQSLVAQRTESIALIPSRAGQFVIPPVEVEWFNVVTESIESAQLPAQSVTVLPATGGNPPSSNVGNNATSLQNNGLAQENRIENNNPVSGIASSSNLEAQLGLLQEQFDSLESRTQYWQWSTYALSALILVIFVVYLLSRFKQPKQIDIAKNEVAHSEPDYWKKLINDVSKQNVRMVKTSLLAWLQQATSLNSADISTILKALGQQSILDELNMMYESQYGNKPSDWQESKLKNQLTVLRNELIQKRKSTTATLKPLYPV